MVREGNAYPWGIKIRLAMQILIGKNALLFCLLSLVFFMAFIEVGYSFGLRYAKRYPSRENWGGGAIEAAVLALFGLLLAFTFAAAQSRLEERRQLIAEEANAIGTAYLRLDLLPLNEQKVLKEEFRRYLDARLQAYAALPDVNKAYQELRRSEQLQKEIWSRAQSAVRLENWQPAAILLLPALNEMIDITTKRTMIAQSHTPSVVFLLLYVVGVITAVMSGFGMAKTPGRNWLHRWVFALVVSMTLYVIMDLEFPRIGLIRLDAADHALVELRQSMN